MVLRLAVLKRPSRICRDFSRRTQWKMKISRPCRQRGAAQSLERYGSNRRSLARHVAVDLGRSLSGSPTAITVTVTHQGCHVLSGVRYLLVARCQSAADSVSSPSPVRSWHCRCSSSLHARTNTADTEPRAGDAARIPAPRSLPRL